MTAVVVDHPELDFASPFLDHCRLCRVSIVSLGEVHTGARRTFSGNGTALAGSFIAGISGVGELEFLMRFESLS